ncbi:MULTISPECIES: hypothetical protein [unclassified Ruegeria]|uniref:hypothetical protein n=1 Tax=unclassified Ruegeria TaxID=2625375 RepID=UPI001491EC4F|nr:MULTISPECIES: hypothetical protein [unclassified Ruegeria]NOD36634.1 hypothetical protein [Ruegeria sp. HKCCD7296]NOE43867.1 hypothetical protein [Ruegeria sp. HKCCD7319]
MEKLKAIEALQSAQITNDYQKLVAKLAGPLHDNVALVFPGHMQMLYLLTNARRRQVWNAVLAAERTISKLAESQNNVTAMRHALLSQKSADLLAEAYGDMPPSFEALLFRFGFVAQEQETYSKLYALAHDGPRLRKQILNEKRLSSGTIDRLSYLPQELRCLHFAKSFQKDRHVQTFVDIYDELRAENFPDWKELKDKLHLIVRQRRDVSSFMRSMYVRLPFPAQHVPDCHRVRFLSNGLAMEAASKRYRNCLSEKVPQALRGDRQYYEWTGKKQAIVEIFWHRARWEVDEIRLKRNHWPCEELFKTILAHFARHGVNVKPDLPQKLEQFIMEDTFDFGDRRTTFEDRNFDLTYVVDAEQRLGQAI